MPLLRRASLGVLLLLLGCSSVSTKPIEHKHPMPATQRHFIVMEPADRPVR